MNAVLEVQTLSKSYPVGKTGSQTILREVDLRVGRGEFVAVMGASGSGKSTLLYNISGMERPDGGSVSLLGRELTALSEPELARLRLEHIGYVFQQSNLLRNLNLFDNIVLPAYRARREDRRAINRRAQDLMEHLGIAELADKDITQASGGQLQRVAICRALINRPDMVFGDEPTGALNSGATAEVMEILAGINADGTTVLLVTHDVKVAARAGRVLYMTDGRITGELALHAPQPGTAARAARESLLSDWLAQQGF